MVDVPAACSALLLCLSGSDSQARQILEQHGIWLIVSYDPAEARQRLQRLQPDVLIIRLSGRRDQDWETCQDLASCGSQPMLVLVEERGVDARLAAFACGADDVLDGTFHPLELVARVRALGRRSLRREQTTSLLHHQELVLDTDCREAILRDTPLQLTPVEFRLLATLLESPQRAFGRDELVAKVHGFDDRQPSERSIDLHVSQLRQKLGDSPDRPRYIESVRGLGYRLARTPGPAAS